MVGPLVLSVVVTVAAQAEPGPSQQPPTPEDAERLEFALSDVLASCEKALGSGECTRVGDDEGTWRASVVFLRDAATVTLSRPNRVIVRSLEFLPEDSEKQRRVAAGLLVAAMTAAARLSEPEPPAPKPEEVAPARPEPPKVVTRPAPARRAPPSSASPSSASPWSASPRARRLELGALAGPTLGGTHWGGGALLAVSADLRPEFGAGGGVEGLYSNKDGYQVLKLGVGLGPRIHMHPGVWSVGWSLALEGVLDYTRITTTLLEEATQGALRGGGRLRTSVSFGGGKVRPLLGLGITALSPGLEIRRDETVLVPAFLGSAFLGILLNGAE
jgi:hypothetical protein